jgi:hypothetical protein
MVLLFCYNENRKHKISVNQSNQRHLPAHQNFSLLNVLLVYLEYFALV